jgi:hypothetical protein
MYKRIDLTKLGGYPLAQEDLDWLQNSYRNTFASLANFIGDKVIIDGMVEAGGNVSAGWISMGGEIVPFLGGTIGTGTFMIDELITPLVFDDGVSKDVLYERVAKFSVTGTFNYSDLKRINTLKETWVRGDVKEVDCTLAYISANFDVTGLGINERTGWAICNGNNSTKDRAQKVSVGYDPTAIDFDDTIKTGGSNAHKLQSNQQGTFEVRKKTDDGFGTTGGGYTGEVDTQFNNQDVPTGGANASTWGNALTVSLSEAQQEFSIMQPYQVTLFIQKL